MKINDEFWKNCNICKKQIGYSSNYYICSVSTCTRKRTGLVFCSVMCWDAHVPTLRHKDPWAEEKTAPSKSEWIRYVDEESQPKKRVRKPKTEIVEKPKTTIIRRKKSS